MNRIEELLPEFDPNRNYRVSELNELTDKLLREDARSELCRECGELGHKTGNTESLCQEAMDEEGNQLVLEFSEFSCANGHCWYQGEGAMRGIGGKNPILFKEHFDSRRRREIYNGQGFPDPSIVQGLYNRAHPQGRKINTPEARAKHGASYYK